MFAGVGFRIKFHKVVGEDTRGPSGSSFLDGLIT